MDKVCAFCSRGEKSLLGQGELTRYEPTPAFNPFKRQLSRVSAKRALSETDEIGSRRGQQSLTWRRARGPLRQQSRSADTRCRVGHCLKTYTTVIVQIFYLMCTCNHCITLHCRLIVFELCFLNTIMIVIDDTVHVLYWQKWTL